MTITQDGAQGSGTEAPARPVTSLYGGRYELLKLVGVGGAGTVYQAKDVELDEIVALKVLRKELVRTRESIERFRSEVKLARRVTHRNVARMFDIETGPLEKPIFSLTYDGGRVQPTGGLNYARRGFI